MSLASYEIHPRIGVARLGNSPSAFYLAPNEIGGLPLPCDDNGNAGAAYVYHKLAPGASGKRPQS